MVNYEPPPLDATFAALSDPTRRAIVARLAGAGELSVSSLAEPFAISLPAVLKHLTVLVDAGLVVREKRGRTVHCRLEPGPLRAAADWLVHYEQFWNERLDRLERYLE